MDRARRPCPVPGCPHLTDRAKGCAIHRASAPQRQLYDAAWQTFAAGYLRSHRVCEHCRIRAARGVHHKEALALAPHRKLDRTNVVALCHDCHRVVTPTVRDDAGQTRRRTR